MRLRGCRWTEHVNVSSIFLAMGQLHGIALQCPWPFDMFSSHLHMDVKRVQVTASRPARLSVTWVTRRSILRPSLTSAN